MNKLLKFFDRISFKKLFALTFIVAVVISAPIVVWTAQQQTKSDIGAYFDKPEPIAPQKIYGPIPAGEPQITLVWPFVGKVNDAVLIHGLNFGNNPKEKTLLLGNQRVPEDYIKNWTPELIEFLIPPNSNFGPISVNIAGKQNTWPFPFTVYELATNLQVTEKDGIVWTKNTSQPVKIILYMDDGEVIENDNPQEGMTYPTDKKIVSVKVVDQNNNSLPFFVEPSEFGF